MTPRRHTTVATAPRALCIALIICGCAGAESGRDTTTIPLVVPVLERVPIAADSATVFAAEIAFVGFLEASREGFKGGPVQWDTIVGCDPSPVPAFPISMLSRYTVLPSGMRGDTVVVRAAVLSVAEQDEDDRRRGRYVASQRVRTDTLEWDVVREERGNRFLVCNGVRFGFVGDDSLTMWRGPNASFVAARALAAMMYKDRR